MRIMISHILKTLTRHNYYKVCVAELGRLWSSDITLKEILSLIYGLLLEPDLENPLEIQASLKYCGCQLQSLLPILQYAQLAHLLP